MLPCLACGSIQRWPAPRAPSCWSLPCSMHAPRRYSHHLGVSRRHDHGGNGAVSIAGLPLCGVTPETVVAMHRLGGMVRGAIACHQALARKPPTLAPPAMVRQALTDLKIPAMEVTGHARIPQVTALMVPRNLVHAQQGAGIIASLGLLAVMWVIRKTTAMGCERCQRHPKPHL